MSARLQGKIALVTGASRGIGAAVAKRYAAEGAHVLLLARTIGGLEEVDDAIQTAGGTATIVPCDLKEGAKIDELGGVIAKRYGKLDILVGNAGLLGVLSPVGHIPPNTWDDVFNVNVTANYRLLRSFDALLKQSDAGRALFVTSGIAHVNAPNWSAYAASKAALEKLVECYAEEVNHTNIRVNLVNPGEVATRMHKQAMPGIDESTLPKPEDVTEVFVELAESSFAESGKIIEAKVA